MTQINKIYVDGYKNISETTLVLARPNQSITILLAPNNYGKTNMLDAIKFAASLVGMGDREQQRKIRRNEYTSHNTTNASKCFSFEIDFSYDDVGLVYGFEVSPGNGVEAEWLKVNDEEVFTRYKSDEGKWVVSLYKSLRYLIPDFLLFVSVPIVGEDDSSIDAKVGKYTEIVREALSKTASMLYDKETSVKEYTEILSTDIERDEKIIEFFEKKADGEFNDFKVTFLNLFPDITDFRFVELYYGLEPKKRKDRTPDAYRLEFDQQGKKTVRFNHLSSGTRNVFLLILNIFIRRENPLIAIEEIENGIHMSLYRDILNVLADICRNTKVLLTTHSLPLTKHFQRDFYSSYYVGSPNDQGYANFQPLKPSMEHHVRKTSKVYRVAIGELIFDMLTNTDDTKAELKGWLGHE